MLAVSVALKSMYVKEKNTESKKTQNRWVRGVQSFQHHFCVPPLNVTKNEKIFLHYTSTFIMIAQASSNREFSKLQVPQGTAQEAPRTMEQSCVSFSRLFLISNGLWLTE